MFGNNNLARINKEEQEQNIADPIDVLFDGGLGQFMEAIRDNNTDLIPSHFRSDKNHRFITPALVLTAFVGSIIYGQSAQGAEKAIAQYYSDLGEWQRGEPYDYSESVAEAIRLLLAGGAIAANTLLNYTPLRAFKDEMGRIASLQGEEKEQAKKYRIYKLIAAIFSQGVFSLSLLSKDQTPAELIGGILSTIVGVALIYMGVNASVEVTKKIYWSILNGFRDIKNGAGLSQNEKQAVYEKIADNVFSIVESHTPGEGLVSNSTRGEPTEELPPKSEPKRARVDKSPLNTLPTDPVELHNYRVNFLKALNEAWVRILSMTGKELDEAFERFVSLENRLPQGNRGPYTTHQKQLAVLHAHIKLIVGDKSQAGWNELLGENFEGEHSSLLLARLFHLAMPLKAVEGNSSTIGSIFSYLSFWITGGISVLGQSGYFYGSTEKAMTLGTNIILTVSNILFGLALVQSHAVGIGQVIGGLFLLLGGTPLVALSFKSAQDFIDMITGLFKGQQTFPRVILGKGTYWSFMLTLTAIAIISVAGTWKSQNEILDVFRDNAGIDKGEIPSTGFIAGETLFLLIGWISAILFNGVLALDDASRLLISIINHVAKSCFERGDQIDNLILAETFMQAVFKAIEERKDKDFAKIFEGEHGKAVKGEYDAWVNEKQRNAASSKVFVPPKDTSVNINTVGGDDENTPLVEKPRSCAPGFNSSSFFAKVWNGISSASSFVCRYSPGNSA